jgi:hypothetical protein
LFTKASCVDSVRRNAIKPPSTPKYAKSYMADNICCQEKNVNV